MNEAVCARQKRRTVVEPRIVLLALALACGGGQGGSGGITGDEARATLLALSLEHVKDSDGATASSGATVTLAFEPGGVADLHVASHSDALAYQGIFTYDGKTLHLTFGASDFHPDASFAIDLSSDTVELPFRVFSPDPGSSTWTIQQPLLAQNIFVVFQSALLSGDRTVDEAMDSAVAYAEAATATTTQAGLNHFYSVRSLALSGDAPPTVKKVGNTLEICYQATGCRTIYLFQWQPNPFVKEVGMGPLYSDVRLPFPTVPQPAYSADPPERTVLFIRPFEGKRQVTYVQRDASDPKHPVGRLASTVIDEAKNPQSDAAWAVLQSRGYQMIDRLDADKATVRSIVSGLLPGGARQHSPGVVFFDSHGGSDGSLLTGETLPLPAATAGRVRDPEQRFRDAFADYKRTLVGEDGFKDLPDTALDFGYTFGGFAKADFVPTIGVTPSFWSWLHARAASPKADLQHSLVYLNACNVGQNAALPGAIGAGALFAFREHFTKDLDVIFPYLVTQLKRYNRSAEEAYYNFVRVVRTLQAIYPEDLTLTSGNLRSQSGQSSNPADLKTTSNFQAWGSDGGPPVSFWENSWMTTGNPGAVFLLLLGSRGTLADSVRAAADTLRNCWTKYWTQKQSAPFGDMCRDLEPGGYPTDAQVDYAVYLLTGQTLVGGSKHVPRWTLAEKGN